MTTHNDRLNDLISNTQSIATDLLEFQPYVPNAANISALVSELHAISAGLQDLFTVSNDPRNFHDTRLYADARWAVVETLKRTLEDLDRYIRKKDRRSPRSSRQEVYSTIWVDLNEFFLEQSNNILFDRINCIKLFLEELVFILKGGDESRDFNVRYQRIEKLLAIQEEDLSQELRRLELQRDALATPAKSKSWERKRPGPVRNTRGQSPPVAPQPPTGINRHPPASPISPSGPRNFWNPGPDPVRPDSPPTSSASTASPSSASPPSSAGSVMANHWLRSAFSQSRPTTNFSMTSTEHALQIFRDERSDGIRLQASILSGEKKTTPVWTAFINYKISAFKWIKRVEPHKIHLADLPRYIFIDDYSPHMGSNGEHEIHFDNAEDTERFAKAIEDLADHKI
ncbi:MAG: hypothetical protein GOMPHAMPRED_003234 [Gomphillus americanus]|uniref:PH domain-containing protein n=1 Tax=Gomphillus americanus TaxID=1940652 RepID=A0A8H3EFC5_9LECA|nr:MAG: hypothetical protein GOMPHAMPRED_003234 [Gomphillus americanus]